MRVINLLFLVLLVGCSTSPKPLKRNKLPIAVNAMTVPTVMRGCAWTIQQNYDPLIEWFEVWATTNLSEPFVLAATTRTNYALFPEKRQEFYKVRTINVYGEFSDWATTQ